MVEKKKATKKHRYYIATYKKGRRVSIVEFDATSLSKAKVKLKRLVDKDLYKDYVIEEVD